jgi:hypothetical protein
MPIKYIDEDTIKPFEFKPLENDHVTPKHYHIGNIDVIEFLERYFPENKFTVAEGFYIGNILKYVCRHKEKGGMADLEKAEKYLHKLMEGMKI